MKNFVDKLVKAYGVTAEVLKFKPCRQLIIANDKLTEVLFTRSDARFQRILANGCQIVEKKTKKFGEIITKFELRTQIQKPLNQFDRACLNAVMSQYLAGNEYITTDMIYRTLCGKSNTPKSIANATDAQKAAIRASVDNMASIRININMEESKEKLRYAELKDMPIPTFKDNLIPCAEINDVVVGGVFVDAVYKIRDLSPLYKIAKIKKQLLTCDIDLLDVPSQHNSDTFIGVKWYILQRVLESKLHRKNMTPTVTLEDIFTKCGLTEEIPKRKKRFAGYINAFFEHLENCGLILGFEVSAVSNCTKAFKFIF